MRLRFWAIPVTGDETAVAELNAFLAGHRIVTVDRQLVQNAGASLWAVAVTYIDTEGAKPVPSKKGRIDYREVLSEPDFAVFAKLRSLRKQLAEAEAVPAYALFTNEQLAAMARGRPRSLTDLAAIEGVGPARIDKYGDAFVEVLLQHEVQVTGGADHDAD